MLYTTWCQKWFSMASVKLQPPSPFNIQSPDNWLRGSAASESFAWHQDSRLKRYSPGFYTPLLYGRDSQDVLGSTDITTDKNKHNGEVIKKFDTFFKVRKNIIFKWMCFNLRCQEEGETTEQFITSLYQFNLVEDCKYGALKDQMIHDRIVVGIRDKVLSQCLQLDPDLTMEKVKTLTCQQEAIQEQQVILDNRST